VSYYRRVSPGERAFHLARETDPYSRKYLQVVIEGRGELKLPQWQAAVTKAVEAHLGSHLVLKGHLGMTRWDSDGVWPTVREVFTDWDGYDFNQPFLFPPPIDIRRDPLGEVLLLQGPIPMMLLRVHHAAMDGVGALFFLKDIFRILRSEAPLGSNSVSSEIDVWRTHNFGRRQIPSVPTDAITPFGPSDGTSSADPVWERRSIPGKARRIIPKMALILAQRTWQRFRGTFRIAMFVNLRRHLPAHEITLANCTSMIHVNVDPGDTEDSLRRKIFDQMRARTYLDMSPYVSAVHWIPARVFKPGGGAIRRQYERGTFRASVYITHIGSFSPELFSYDGFRACRMIPIPPSDATAPLSMAICEASDAVDIVANAPAAFAGNARLGGLMDDLQRTLSTPSLRESEATI
jgi:hypothetical protein